MAEHHFTIHVNPVVLKNSKRIIVSGGRRIVISSKKVEAAQHKALEQLAKQWPQGEYAFHPCARVNATILSYLPMRADSGLLPDASNLYQFPEDMLEAAGILADDRQIESHDGSRRICLCDTCEERLIIARGPRKGERKESCGKVKGCTRGKIEISLAEIMESNLERKGED
jgi:Holliday junction resolvase RusA-like endonuclease